MKTATWITLTCSLTAALAGCADFAAPSELDHPRILAVRASQPHLTAGESARIDLLATDGVELAVVPPDTVAVAPGPGAERPEEMARLVAEDEEGYAVTAPSEEALAELRAALGLPEGAPVPLFLQLSATVGSELKHAEKVVFLGSDGENPRAEAILAGGAQAQEDGIDARIGRDLELEVIASGTGTLDFSWHSSVGPIERYRDRVAVLAAEEAAEGVVVAVVRDDAGGVGWLAVPARVEK